MQNNSKTKPLEHYPSAMAQDQAPLHMPRRRSFARGFAKFVVFFTVLIAVSTAGIYLFLSRGPISNERLRQEIVVTLSSMMGPRIGTTISNARISVGESGLLAIAANDVSLSRKSDGLEFGSAGSVHIGLEILPLLQGKYQVESILVNDAVIDINRFLTSNNPQPVKWPDALHLDKIMQVPAERLYYIAGEMKSAGLERVTWRNLRVREKTNPGERPRDIMIHEIEINNFKDTGDLEIKASASIDGRKIKMEGSWKTTSEGHALQLNIAGLDASDIMESARRSKTGPVGLDAPVQVSYYHPYSNTLTPMQSTVRLDIGKGFIRFDRKDIAEFSGGQINIRLIPEKNQIELEKSPITLGASSAVLTGGIRFPLPGGIGDDKVGLSNAKDEKSAENIVRPIFELIANDIIASPSDSPEPPVQASFRVSGRIDATQKILDLDEVRVWSEGGNLQGAGSIGFAGETPSLALALTIPRISVTALKQLWPIFLATGARKWVMEHVRGGEVVNAEINAAIPAGIIGKIRDGKKLAPEHLNIRLGVNNTTIIPPGDLPIVTNASGEVNFIGMETFIVLDGGKIYEGEGAGVSISKGKMKIGDFKSKPTMAELDLDLSGSASNILKIASSKPLRVADVINIRPKELTGKAEARINIRFPLKKQDSSVKIDWNADINLKKVSLAAPLEGYRVSGANVSIQASPGVAKIKGKALLDGIPTTLSLTQPFGKSSKADASRAIKLTLDSRARRKIGINLDEILAGPVSVSYNMDKKSKTGQYKIDLTAAKLSFPWANWVKGKGIKSSATFEMGTVDGITRISNFKLTGSGNYNVAGKFKLDKRGLISGIISRLSLNKGDNLKVDITRSRGTYVIKARGKSYDARAIINQILDNGTPKSKATSKYNIRLDAKIGRVLGFGGEVLKDVSLQYNEKNGQLTSAVMEGLASGNARTALSIKPDKGKTTTIMVSTNAGSTLRFLDIYRKMKGGTLSAALDKKGTGPHKGRVILKNFRITGEPRLKRLLSAKQTAPGAEGREGLAISIPKPSANPDDLKVNIVSADIIKTADGLTIKNGIMRAGDVGSNFSGDVYDASGNMNLKGTYLPGYGLNKLVSKIPIVGLAFGNGTKRGLLGITYRLRGKAKNPKIAVNPISIVAPGIFRKVFEFR